MPLSPAEINSLTFAYDNFFGKLFKTYNKQIIQQCQFFCHCFPFYALYEYHRYLFLVKLFNSDLVNDRHVLFQTDMLERNSIASKFGFTHTDSKRVLKFKVWKFLETNIVFETV